MRALRVGLTGGIGAGKSLALKAVARLGATTIDADDIARAQARKGGAAYRGIVRAFGREVLRTDGRIDRAKLAERVFSDVSARRRLERITHPLVKQELIRRLKAARRTAVAAVPLLFEVGVQSLFDVTMTIEAARSVRRRRVSRRDGLTEAQVAARIKTQLPSSARLRRADIVVRNDEAKSRFLSKVRFYYQAFELLSHGAAAVK